MNTLDITLAVIFAVLCAIGFIREYQAAKLSGGYIPWLAANLEPMTMISKAYWVSILGCTTVTCLIFMVLPWYFDYVVLASTITAIYAFYMVLLVRAVLYLKRRGNQATC